MTMCQICKKVEFKYKCPGCLLLTCSLLCVNMHKEESKCTGKKNALPTHAIKLKMCEMGINTLRKDIAFIENGISLTNMTKKETA